MTRLYENPPAEISHSGKKLRLTERDEPFTCDGCKEPGSGPRYRAAAGGGGSQSFDLHTCCALTEDMLVHPLFRNCTFKFLAQTPPPVEGTICDACGLAASGFVYHCKKKDLDLHPCCASLPERILQDGRVFELRRKASQPCGNCGGDGGHRSRFWSYRTYLDGVAVDIHVACMKEMARLSWESTFQNWVGGAQIVRPSEASIESMLRSLPGNARGSDGFAAIAGAVVSTAIAVIFGNPMAMVTAVAGGVGSVLRA